MRIDIAVFDGVDELDVFGPLETLRSAGVFDVRLVTRDGQEAAVGAHGTRFLVDGAYEPGADLLLLPGGGWATRAERGAWAEAQSGRWTPVIRAAGDAGAVLAAVCTGAMLLATAGVLTGRRATTHHSAWADLEAAGAVLVRDRVVDDGDVVTAGGVTSGIDLALWLIERFAGADQAARAAERLEYRPERPAPVG